MKQHLIILLLIVVNSLGATAQKFDPSGSKSLGSQENLKGKSDSLGYGTVKFTAWKFGFNIIEVPIIFTDRTEGTSKMSGGIFNEAVWGVIKMKLRSFFTKYER
jgi:hypothetical protein